MERITLRGDGLDLAADAEGPAGAPVILFLHGGGQTRQSWGAAIAEAARRGYRGIAIDLRGHGDSDWAPDSDYAIERFAADIRAVVQAIGGTPAIVGASLGGIAALLVAADPPPRLGALVLVDITPRIAPEGTAEIMAFMGSAPNGFASLDEAADAVAAYLPHRPRPKDTSGLARNLRLRDGRYHWHWDPAFLSLGPSTRETDHNEAALGAAAERLALPTLLIRGSHSRLVSDEAVAAFRAQVPDADYVDIAGAHHMVAGDANDAFNTAAFTFLDRVFQPTSA